MTKKVFFFFKDLTEVSKKIPRKWKENNNSTKQLVVWLFKAILF